MLASGTGLVLQISEIGSRTGDLMTHMGLKLSIAGVVLVGAVAYLAFAGMQRGSVYTMGVDQYVTSPDQQAKRVRLCGRVGEEEFEVHKAQLTAKFRLKGDKEVVTVAYRGAIPDMFKTGADVIVEGQRDSSGVFNSDTIMTKCASKYEEMPKSHPPVTQASPTAQGDRP